MKKILKKLGVTAASAVLLTGCLEETFPTSTVTEEQLLESSKASEALLNGIPGQMKSYFFLGSTVGRHSDFGYPSLMIIRDIMTGDFIQTYNNYASWFYYWARNIYQGQDYILAQEIYTTYCEIILSANQAIGALPADSEDDTILAYRGMALAFRAAMWLDMARMYEWLPNDKTSNVNAEGNDITGLTIPIITESTTEEEARNNPRVTHEQIAELILAGLDEAESLVGKAARPSKQFPDLAVVYGLKARYYMWEENYPKAAEYARMAISAHSGSPLTQLEWHNTSTGFNDIESSSWMWGLLYAEEENAVLTGIINWTSWMANEGTFGYAGVGGGGVVTMIDASLYSSINNTDFRKLSYKAPESSSLSGRESYINQEWFDAMETYSSLKFRPASGNGINPEVACACGVPLMRVEEMYLIEAEATAQTSPSAGKDLLESFVNTYRDASYKCNATDKDGVVDACFQQKRIELWGEGLILFDIKRLNKSVTRVYSNTNWPEIEQFNTNGRPAWMNFVITGIEEQSNVALMGKNNPDPSGLY